MPKQSKEKILNSKIRNIYNISEKQKAHFRKHGMFKQLSIPFKDDYRDKKSGGGWSAPVR
jgi:hypothetical protein